MNAGLTDLARVLYCLHYEYQSHHRAVYRADRGDIFQFTAERSQETGRKRRTGNSSYAVTAGSNQYTATDVGAHSDIGPGAAFRVPGQRPRRRRLRRDVYVTSPTEGNTRYVLPYRRARNEFRKKTQPEKPDSGDAGSVDTVTLR